MARKNRWEVGKLEHGIVQVDLFDWKYFNDYIYQELLHYRTYIFRGQRCDNWALESTLDRVARSHGGVLTAKRRLDHLAAFKYAVRGRRGANPARLDSENDWWALGQHHGLATPLLDWTTSPFVAAYFAFAADKHNNTKRRVVWALAQKSLERKSAEIQKVHSGEDRPPVIEFFKPLSDENARLVNQGGLFSRGPDGFSCEQWLKSNFHENHATFLAIKITIPSVNRQDALKSLNRMNINHLTLFPDLYGASVFCNTDLEIAGY